MGTIVAVDSVVYNMAGEEENRPQYLQTLVVRNVLSGTKDSMGDTLNSGYLNGPAIKLRSFYRWAENPDNFGQIGLPTGALEVHGALNPNLVSSAISTGADETSWVQLAKVGFADHFYWAEQWVLENRPGDIGTAWTADYDEAANNITITFVDTSVQIIPATDFDYLARYIYAYYTIVHQDAEGPLNTGSTVILAPADSFPDTTGWTHTVDELTYDVYERQSIIEESAEGELLILVETMHQYDDGVDRSYRIDTQENVYRNYNDTKLLIYKVGSGNVDLDNLVTEGVDYGEFFPFLPIRLANTFLSETYLPDAYAQVKTGYRRATSGRLSKLIDQLSDNESLEDIDHAYVSFGVSLNVVEKSCKKYLYKFFEKLQLSQAGGPNTYDLWKTDVEAQQTIAEEWVAWKEAQSMSSGDGYDPEPPRAVFPELPMNQIRITGTGAINAHYDVRVEWVFINNGAGIGLGKVGAKKGDIWFEFIGQDTITRLAYLSQATTTSFTETDTYDKIRLYWQQEDDSYTYLEIIGAVHRNYIYRGKAVVISAKTALEDPEESGFIIPLHYDTWREISLKDASQMATACVFMVFNCYVAKKTKWYESGIFKILLVIVIAIASVVFTGGAGFGLLGAHLSVGTALGFTGMTAAIVGAVANAMAALVLATILEKVAGALGPIGAIITTLIMIVVGQVSAAFQGTGSLTINWGDLLRADNLLRLTDATGRAISGMLNQDTMGIRQDWLDYEKNMAQESNKIQQAYFEEFGYGGGLIDPLMFVDASEGPLAESSDTFLTRTLMTGSEIAEMSRELLYEFPEYSLTLPNAFT